MKNSRVLELIQKKESIQNSMDNIVDDFNKQIETLNQQIELAKYQTTIGEILNLYDYDNDGYFSQSDVDIVINAILGKLDNDPNFDKNNFTYNGKSLNIAGGGVDEYGDLIPDSKLNATDIIGWFTMLKENLRIDMSAWLSNDILSKIDEIIEKGKQQEEPVEEPDNGYIGIVDDIDTNINTYIGEPEALKNPVIGILRTNIGVNQIKLTLNCDAEGYFVISTNTDCKLSATRLMVSPYQTVNITITNDTQNILYPTIIVSFVPTYINIYNKYTKSIYIGALNYKPVVVEQDSSSYIGEIIVKTTPTIITSATPDTIDKSSYLIGIQPSVPGRVTMYTLNKNVSLSTKSLVFENTIKQYVTITNNSEEEQTASVRIILTPSNTTYYNSLGKSVFITLNAPKNDTYSYVGSNGEYSDGHMDDPDFSVAEFIKVNIDDPWENYVANTINCHNGTVKEEISTLPNDLVEFAGPYGDNIWLGKRVGEGYVTIVGPRYKIENQKNVYTRIKVQVYKKETNSYIG